MLARRSDVTLAQAQDAGDGALTSRVLIDGTDSGLTVHGIDLGAAFATPHGTLLFVEYGDDWEQSLTITLADPDMKALDSASLAVSGASGHLHDVREIGPDSVEFRFFGERRWVVRLHPAPRFVMPFAALGLGVQRPFQWWRWFSLGPG